MLHRVSSYQVEGRLNDVIAALTVLAAHKDSTNTIERWVDHLSKVHSPKERVKEIDRWQRVFVEHPEFFIVYRLPTEQNLKAALRLRYANKTIDTKTGKVPENFTTMSIEERNRLGSLPLEPEIVNNLTSTAINIHSASIARRTDRRHWIGPSATIGAVVVGALLSAFLSKITDEEPVQPKIEIKLEAPQGTKAAAAAK